MATVRSRRKAGTRAPAGPVRRRSRRPGRPAPPFRHGVRHNVGVTMSDGVVLRGDIHYPTVPGTGLPAAGPFPVLLSDPLRQKGPATGRPDRRWRHPVSDQARLHRGDGRRPRERRSGGCFEMFGARQTQDGIELVDWASTLPNASGRVGMFGTSYLAINQLFTAAGVGPDSPLKAIFPVMAARDFYRDAAAMGGVRTCGP